YIQNQLDKLTTGLVQIVQQGIQIDDQHLNVRILWARGKNLFKQNPLNDTNSFRLEDYVQQKSVLNHRAMRKHGLYINHCGMGSMHESIFYGIPQLAFPLFVDQIQVAVRSHQLGTSLLIDKDNFTPDEIVYKVETIVRNPEIYRSN
ncbi:unnamed protein product, partial [Didymodactylos carnosus]